jgi:hypothetical protein
MNLINLRRKMLMFINLLEITNFVNIYFNDKSDSI